METAILIIGAVAAAGFAIWKVIDLAVTRMNENDESIHWPRFRVIPAPHGLWVLQEKNRTPFPGTRNAFYYRSMHATYRTREQAEADIEHLTQEE